jgi:hypothetical protein
MITKMYRSKIIEWFAKSFRKLLITYINVNIGV